MKTYDLVFAIYVVGSIAYLFVSFKFWRALGALKRALERLAARRPDPPPNPDPPDGGEPIPVVVKLHVGKRDEKRAA